MEFKDIMELLTFLTVIIGGCFALYKWNKIISIKRARYLNTLSEKLRNDKIIRSVFSCFDYNTPWYDQNFHGSGKFEHEIDKTLTFFSYMCYLKYEKIIQKDEFILLEYHITRTLQNEQVQDYLYNIYQFGQKFNKPIPFYYLIQYGLKSNLIPQIFLDPEAYIKYPTRFHRYINFQKIYIT